MNFSLSRVLIIARREYLTTVRRKAFILSLLLTPTILYVAVFLSQKQSGEDFKRHFQQTRIVAVVDSSGLYANAPREYSYHPPAEAPAIPTTRTAQLPAPKSQDVKVFIRPYASQAIALDSLSAGNVNAVLVVAGDYLASGRVRRYENDTRAVTSSGDDRPLRWWLTQGLLANVDSTRSARVWALGNSVALYTPARSGGYAIKDDSRELIAIFFPFVLGFLLGMSIMSGGQYLLQGIAEEKESRILESMLCTVNPAELMAGKLIGLGGAGLTLVAVWITVGAAAMGGTLSLMHIEMPASVIALAVLYFFFGYLFFASLMTGIGAMSNNSREAQQAAVIFSMMNFFPMWTMMSIVNNPTGAWAVGLSMFPGTAATTMMMRLSTAAVNGGSIPLWQIAASLGILATCAVVALMLSAKVFRLGLLLYGKTPNLPEIMNILRQK
jgi:ABC-2 type transport system permease protein